MFDEIICAESIKALMLIIRMNRFYRDTSTQTKYQQYRLCVFLSNHIDEMVSDITEYLNKLGDKLSKEDVKEYKKYSALIAALKAYEPKAQN